MKFEVFIPGKTVDDFDITLKIKAASWLEALKAGLSRMGEDSGLIKHILIDIMEDNTIHVTETVNSRVFRIKELEEEAPKENSNEAKLKAEEERLRSEAEARIKAELEAKIKAELEAKIKAELEAKLKKELEANNISNSNKADSIEIAIDTDSDKSKKIELNKDELLKIDTIESTTVIDSENKDSQESTLKKDDKTDETVDDSDELELTAQFQAKLKAEKEIKTLESKNGDLSKTPDVLVEKKLTEEKEIIPEVKKEIPPIQEVKKEIPPVQEIKKEIPPVQTKKVDYEIEEVHKQQATQKIFVGRSEKIKEIDVDAILSELYFDISDIDSESNISAAMEIAMDLSMKYIECDSGSLYLVDLNKNDIYFSAIRGPKAEDLKKLNIRIPMGIGIVGFCAEENVSLAISDVNRDPRFYRAISQKLGYPTYSILSVPMYKRGRVYGVIQLINKHSSNTFTPGEVGVIDYICKHVAEYLDRKINRYY
ncbi:GAF domain-containing protein [bacterium]|nr:GAF domain-containing protein [bacterium]